MGIGHSSKPCPVCGTDQSMYERTLNNTKLLKCLSCGFVYADIDNRDILLVNSRFDNNYTVRYEQIQTHLDTLWFGMISQKLTRIAGRGKVLDVGCGNGALLRQFAERHWQPYGLDVSPWAEEFARRWQYTLFNCTLEESDVPDSYFDAVTSTSTLEHIPQPYLHVKRIMRALKSGGIAYFSGMPNYGSLAIELNMSGFNSNKPPLHANYFTHNSLYSLFGQPDIVQLVDRIAVRSYGIPELDTIYRILAAKRSKGGKRSNGGSDGRNVQQRSLGPARKSRILRLGDVYRLFISIHYHLGRPFHMGDKLECMVIKK